MQFVVKAKKGAVPFILTQPLVFFALKNINSKTMVDIHDYDIQCIEQEILWKHEDIRFDYSDYDCLLSLRKDMINRRVLA